MSWTTCSSECIWTTLSSSRRVATAVSRGQSRAAAVFFDVRLNGATDDDEVNGSATQYTRQYIYDSDAVTHGCHVGTPIIGWR